MRGRPGASWTGRDFGNAIIGLPSYFVTGTIATPMIVILQEGVYATIGNPQWNLDNGLVDGCLLESDDLDAGKPGERKVWRQLQVFFGVHIADPSKTQQIKAALSVDAGLTWDEVTLNTTTTDLIHTFHFNELLGERVRFRFIADSPVDGYLLSSLQQVMIFGAVLGAEESYK
jgi:hypothetical protein